MASKYKQEYNKTGREIAKELGISKDKLRQLHKSGQLHKAIETGIAPKAKWPKTLPKTRLQQYIGSLSKFELIEDSINDGIAYITAIRDGRKPPKSAETVLESLRASRELIVGE